MLNITLICTVHYEQGECNPIELCKIIEHIKPDIIFEELSKANFHCFYDELRAANLETNAIKLYLEDHQIKHIPVDTYDRPKYYDEQVDRMYDKVTSRNMIRECRMLQNAIVDGEVLTKRDGFSYLNCTLNDERMKAIVLLTDQMLSILNNEELFRIRSLEKDVIEKREIEMLTNIYSYSKAHPYNQALFFIGSGHRKSIIKKIIEFDAAQESKLNWSIRDNDSYVPLSYFMS
jgi:hypothetical protein